MERVHLRAVMTATMMMNRAAARLPNPSPMWLMLQLLQCNGESHVIPCIFIPYSATI